MVEVMTDKATVEIPSPRAGRVAQAHVRRGADLPGRHGPDRDRGRGGAAPRRRRRAGGAGRAADAPHAPPRPAPARARRVERRRTPRDAGVLATPATRKLARELGVDIRDGRAAPGRPAASPPTTCARHGGGRRGAARRRARARRAGARRAATSASRSAACARRSPRTWRARSTPRRTSPTSRRSTAPSWSRCASAPTTRAAERGVKLSFLPFIVKATVGGAEEVPAAQRHARRGDAARSSSASTTTSASRPRPTHGLIVPVVRDADRRVALRAGRARSSGWPRLTRTGKATRDELTGSTFTITCLGALGGVLATPIINFPEVAILGVHKISRAARRCATDRSSSAT